MTSTQRTPTAGTIWEDTPAAFKGGIIVGIVAWFVSMSSLSTRSVNGAVVSCSYSDLVKLAAAALLVFLAVVGLRTTRRSRHPLPTWLGLLLTAVLVVDAILLALKGLDVFPSVCRSLGA